MLSYVRREAKVASSEFLILFDLHVPLSQDEFCDKFGFLHMCVFIIDSTVFRSWWRLWSYEPHFTILISVGKLSGHLTFQQVDLEKTAGSTSRENCKNIKIRLCAF